MKVDESQIVILRTYANIYGQFGGTVTGLFSLCIHTICIWNCVLHFNLLWPSARIQVEG